MKLEAREVWFSVFETPDGEVMAYDYEIAVAAKECQSGGWDGGIPRGIIHAVLPAIEIPIIEGTVTQ